MATQIKSIIAVDVDKPTGDVRLVLQGESTKYLLQIARGAVTNIILALVGTMQRSRDDYPGSPDFQPATLTGVRKFSLEADGRPGLLLTIDGGLPLALLIDQAAMPVLRSELLELEELSKAPSPDQPRH